MLAFGPVAHRVFISHASVQHELADLVRARLEGRGVPCWIAPRDLPPGSDWVSGIPAGVQAAELVVVLLSREALTSAWVDREVFWALRHERPLLPVVVGDVEPTDRFEFLFG